MAERTVFQSISRKHVTSLGPQASVRDAACVMTRANCGSVLIMEPPDTLLGILTERDLMTRVLAKGLDPERTTAREVMTPNPICVPPETLVSDAVVLMLERGLSPPAAGGGDEDPGRVLGARCAAAGDRHRAQPERSSTSR